jgi:hypothetical protein
VNFPFIKNRLKKAIERGLANGKLDDELEELGDLTIKTGADGEAICWGLKQLHEGTNNLGKQVDALSGLFQDVEGAECDAFEILQDQGIAELLRLYNLIREMPDSYENEHALMFLLKIFVMYGTTEGTLKVIEAAQQPLNPDGYMWQPILKGYYAGHPQNELLFGSLRDDLPEGFIAVSLVDAANAIMIEGEEMVHPFNTEAGRKRLQEWICSKEPEKFSYAHSATAALPFISEPERDSLLHLSMSHPDASVQMEAAWAAAEIGREEGFLKLVEHCRDFKKSETAKRYLEELNRKDLIPKEAQEPDFEALAEFSQWLAHPNELGHSPDELEIVDHRELCWPPERERKPFWLIQYTDYDKTGLSEDDVECGLVSSMTFSFFSYKLAQRPPEDGYAIHCYWEMEHHGLIEETSLDDGNDKNAGTAGEYDHLLASWRGPVLHKPKMRVIAELSPELKCPQRLVGLATAEISGQQGWVVLDGENSQWYPADEMPDKTSDSLPLKIHIGRQLLGFTEKPDRKKYLKPPQPPKPPEQIIVAYTKLLEEAEILTGEKKKDAFGTIGPISTHFKKYVDALNSLGRKSEILNAINILSRNWDHVTGIGELGKAAYMVGELDIAVTFFITYQKKNRNYERSEVIGLLAEIWCSKGKNEDAQKLLIECLHHIHKESKTATGSDIDRFEKWFQRQRSAFLKLFPTDGDAILLANAIPPSTL